MQYENEKRERLSRLEKKLYSRGAPEIIDSGRSEFGSEDTTENLEEKEIKEDWQDVKTSSFDELAAKVAGATQNKHSFIKKFFIFSLTFFIIAAGVTVFMFKGGRNSVSSENVDIKVNGPLSIPGGQEVSFDINIINDNNTDLNSASLLVKYPSGTRSSSDLTKALDEERFAIDKIRSKASYNQNIKAVFFGEKESIKPVKISLEYRVENSSALFYKEKIHEVSISSSPIIIIPTYPKEINSNQEISFNLELVSNSKDKINNFLTNIEYPFGFVFKEASPKASFNNNIWQFSGLNPGEKKKIVIKGNMIGQDNEEKVFKINIGTASSDDERMIAVPFTQLVESILIKKPFIGLEVFVDGKNGDTVAQGGSQVGSELVLRNNLPERLFNVSVSVSLRGGAFDPASIFAGDGGFFQSFNNTILWDKRSVPEFADMDPGSEEDLSFRLSPLLYSKVSAGSRPEIEMTVTAKGERILESGSVEEVSSVETRKIALATDLSLSSKIARSIGNIENSGPIPPKINVPTTYTVIWGISNSFNQVGNVEVRATLPSYVKWTGLKNPSAEIFSFNQVTNEVVWNAGSILPNTGFSSPKKEIYFQIEFLPSISQVGQSPILIGETTLTGTDKITGLRVETKAWPVTTSFSSDPSYKMGDERVVQ